MRLLRAKKPKAHKTSRDLQREATRKNLLDAARLLFARHGYEGVSVTDIGKEAGVSHAMIYAYFGDKAGLLYEIVRENNEPQLPAALEAARSAGPAVDRIRKVLEIWARYDLADPDLLAVMQAYSWTWPSETEQSNKTEREQHFEIISQLVTEGINNGELAGDIDTYQAGQAIFALYTWGLRPGVFEAVTPEQCVARVWPQMLMLLSAYTSESQAPTASPRRR